MPERHFAFMPVKLLSPDETLLSRLLTCVFDTLLVITKVDLRGFMSCLVGFEITTFVITFHLRHGWGWEPQNQIVVILYRVIVFLPCIGHPVFRTPLPSLASGELLYYCGNSWWLVKSCHRFMSLLTCSHWCSTACLADTRSLLTNQPISNTTTTQHPISGKYFLRFILVWLPCRVIMLLSFPCLASVCLLIIQNAKLQF